MYLEPAELERFTRFASDVRTRTETVVDRVPTSGRHRCATVLEVAVDGACAHDVSVAIARLKSGRPDLIEINHGA